MARTHSKAAEAAEAPAEAADVVAVDLTQDLRDEDGTLYHAGRGRQLPAALAARLKEPMQAPQAPTPDA